MKMKIQKLLHGQTVLVKNSWSRIMKNIRMKSTAMKYPHIVHNATAAVVAIILAQTIAKAGDATINGTMTNTGKFIVKGALAGSVKNIGGTVEFGKSGDQTIPADYTFEKLECTTGGNKSFAGTVTVSDYIKADAAAVKIGTNKLRNTSANANSIQTVNGGTVDCTTGEVEYARNGTQTVYSTSYKNLTIGSGGDKTAFGNIQITGTLTVNDNLVISGASVLTMKNGASQPAFAGLKEVRGIMTWEAYLAQAYTFNNAATVATFSGADAARAFTLIPLPGINPTNYLAGHTVNRTYNISFANWTTGTVDLQLAYQQSEASGVTEIRLRNFKNGIVSANKLPGAPSARGTSGPASLGFVRYSGLSSAQLVATSELALDDRFYTAIISIANAAWNVGTTWQDGVVPTASDSAIINTAVNIQDGNVYSVEALTINPGASTTLQIGGTNSGSLIIGTGGLKNNNADNSNALDVRANGAVDINGVFVNEGSVSNAGRISVQ